ncbi:MAG: rane-associated phospholipid phosphatase [Ferruginibacter sp.]|nr:rane-associated phospholipid phosphatase [Ferruginibacter sp.]
MKSISLLFSLFALSFCSAQQKDSIHILQDSLCKQCTPYFAVLKKNGPILRLNPVIIPAAFISYGFTALKNKDLQKLNNSTKVEIIEDNPKFFTGLDNYLQYAPAAAVYGFNAVGVRGKNNSRDRTIIYTLSTLISAAFVLPTKKLTKVQRPDGSGFNSFPSGHTTTAFASAEFLRQEYNGVSPWYGIGGYITATATGLLRLYNNKHWVNDAIAGAGFGILSMKLAYWIYPAIKRKFFKNKPVNTMILPYYESKGGGLSAVYHFSN